MSGGFWQGGFLSRGFLSGGLCPGVFCPDTKIILPYKLCSRNQCEVNVNVMLIVHVGYLQFIFLFFLYYQCYLSENQTSKIRY